MRSLGGEVPRGGSGPSAAPEAPRTGADLSLEVPAAAAGERIDVFLAALVSVGRPEARAAGDGGRPAAAGAWSRSAVQRLIRQGLVRSDGLAVTRPSEKLRAGQRLEVWWPAPPLTDVLPEPIALDVVYEDPNLIVVNKGRGMVVHPAAGHPGGTLVNALLARCPELHAQAGNIRPGLVHRLDKDTTGLLVVAKDQAAFAALQRQVKEREVKRTYLCLVHGRMAAGEGEIDAAIGRDPRNRKRMAVLSSGGRASLTRWRRLSALGDFDLLEVRPHTGRTHQIRVHMAHVGHPVAGDRVYGPGRPPRRWPALAGLGGQALHAWRLEFAHPRTGDLVSVEAPLPPDLLAVLAALGASVPEATRPTAPTAFGSAEVKGHCGGRPAVLDCGGQDEPDL